MIVVVADVLSLALALDNLLLLLYPQQHSTNIAGLTDVATIAVQTVTTKHLVTRTKLPLKTKLEEVVMLAPLAPDNPGK